MAMAARLDTVNNEVIVWEYKPILTPGFQATFRGLIRLLRFPLKLTA
jgi:hypothetical protein